MAIEKASHLIRGQSAEEIAFKFLIDKGLRPVCRNFHCQAGELDIVMRDQQTLVIVEVRYRKNDDFGGPLASITKKKQNRIITATNHFIQQNNIKGFIRFDVIAVSGPDKINWIKNAFLS